MSRTHRFFGGVVLGHLHLVLVTVVGLWMTPFLLHRLGEQSVGLWLIAQQLLGYLLLMDVGVNALLPREAAFATGRAGGVDSAVDLPRIVARAREAVVWQAPIVAAVAFLTWTWMPEHWRPAAGPLAVMLACFVLLFPVRLYQAFLQGVQELPFLSRLQIGSWTVATLLTIALVLRGYGLYSLVFGWVAGQAITVGLARLRISRRYRELWPAWTLRPAWPDVRTYMRQAGWISVAQVAQVLLTGSDLLVLGSVLGAGAVVQYSCTGKLSTVLSNHPQLIMQAATPALSELRAANRREQLLDATVALMLVMLSVSGLVACLVLALNGSFVSWWVGREQYAGPVLTTLFALHLVVRHLNVTFIYGLFCFGRERRISLTNLSDGAVSIASGVALIQLVGPAGAIIGSLLAVILISMPANMTALSHETGISPRTWCATLWPWLWRFALMAAASAMLPWLWSPAGIVPMMVTAACVTVTYASVMLQGLASGPLGAYVAPRLMGMVPITWRPRLSSSRT